MQEKRKKLSVVIPTYNQEKLIKRTLDSLPAREDLEVVIVNDGSTDGTLEVIEDYIKNKFGSIKLSTYKQNRGVGYAVNKGIQLASGEYIVLLGSDGDYFYTELLEQILNDGTLDGTDLIYFDLITNSGEVFHLDKNTKNTFVGSVKFMRSDFVKQFQVQEVLVAEDYLLYQEMMKKNPTEKFLNKVLKHYNFPRKGSLMDMYSKGELK